MKGFIFAGVLALMLFISVANSDSAAAATKPQTFTFTNVAEVHWESPPGAINSVAFDCATSPGVIEARFNTNKQAWDQVSFDGKTYPIKGIFQVLGCS